MATRVPPATSVTKLISSTRRPPPRRRGQRQQGQGQERRPTGVVERGEGREDFGRVHADPQNARHAKLGYGQDEDHQRGAP